MQQVASPASAPPSALAVLLGVEFSRALRCEIGPEDIQQAVDRNLEETDAKACHTRDFCDADKVMRGAVESLGLPLPGTKGAVRAKTAALMNEAWACAKAAHFKAEAVYSGYTREELGAAFDLVKNPAGWKLTVNKRLPAMLATDSICDRISAALAFFCGSPCDFRTTAQGLRVSAPGYYNCIGS